MHTGRPIFLSVCILQSPPQLYPTEAVEKRGDKPALRVERPLPSSKESMPAEQWTTWTYKAYHAEVRRAAKARVARLSVVSPTQARAAGRAGEDVILRVRTQVLSSV